MPECVLCSSQKFDVMDGMYFCTQCGTQSQDVREEVNELEPGTIDGRLKVKKRKNRQRKVYDLGKPWFTMEAFQVVIKAQIEFLIKIGVDPAIKDVIGQMWFTFVERSSNAFGTRGDKNFSKIIKARDNIKDFIPTNSIHHPPSKIQLGDDALELSSEIAREDFYEDDDPTGGLFEDDKQDEQNGDSNSHIGSVDQNHKDHHKKYYDIQVMTLQHTIAFCFLGLLWLHEPICLSDLIRWAVEGHLPYYNATAYFPSHMKLSQADIRTFTRSTVPSKLDIETLARRLSKCISLPDIPRHQINIYIARYAVDLQLPASIHRHVSSVVEMIDLDLQSLNGIFNYDDLAIAYIIITLRLIYGLDDITEHVLSKLGTDVVEDESLYFPIWNDLIGRIHTSQRLRLENGIPWNKEDLDVLKDSRKYSKFCQDNLFGSWKPESTVYRQFRAYFKGIKGLNAEKQDEYANMFGLLLNTSDNDKVNEKENVTSFPLLSAKNKVCQSDDEVTASGNLNIEQKAKGLRLDIISSYYEKETNGCKESTNHIYKNRYIRYELNRELLDEKSWRNVALSGSLRQLIELCSKLIYCEPAVLLNVIQMVEKKMFEETDD